MLKERLDVLAMAPPGRRVIARRCEPKRACKQGMRVGPNTRFVGVGAILQAGTEIGANSIIGAGSIVRGRFEPGSVIAGNPARAISIVERYFEKNAPSVIDFSGDETAGRRAEIILERLT